jgi:hypothetical protein
VWLELALTAVDLCAWTQAPRVDGELGRLRAAALYRLAAQLTTSTTSVPTINTGGSPRPRRR